MKLETLRSRLNVQVRKLRLYGADPRCIDDLVHATELVTAAATRFARNVDRGWRPTEGSRSMAQARTFDLGDEVAILPAYLHRYARLGVPQHSRLLVVGTETRARVRLRLASSSKVLPEPFARAHLTRRSRGR